MARPAGGLILGGGSRPCQYDVISADGHVDLIWLPPDLFTKNASAAFKDRMPHVVEGPKGPEWVSAKGAKFGLVNGMGSAGREYVPGVIHRSDRMASTGLYDDGKKGIRRLTEPEMRLKDQDRDGVQAEILYGVLGSSGRLNDPEARAGDAAHLQRLAPRFLQGRARPSDRPSPTSRTTTWKSRSPRRCATPSAACAASTSPTGPDMTPLWDPFWEPLWQVRATRPASPLHFHTIGGRSPDYTKMPPAVVRRVQATHITSFQMHMSYMLMCADLLRRARTLSNLKIVIGEAGLGWIPYVLQHMDLEWEDQFQDLDLKMKPSEILASAVLRHLPDRSGRHRACSTVLGEDNVMWGSDYPHPDGIWPDCQEFLARELHEVSAPRPSRKITRDNAMKLYRLSN